MVLKRERHSRAQEKYKEANLDDVRERDRAYSRANRDVRAAWARKHRAELKEEVINHYGGFCVCCGVDELVWLAVDHIEGEGNIERRLVGSSFYEHLKKNHFPSGYQILCMNCNFAKSNGGCPHRDSSSDSYIFMGESGKTL